MKKNIIFYFTGTGNSLKVTRDIASALGEEDCELVHIPDYRESTLPQGYERVGFVYPVYSGEPPVCVERFLKETDFTKNKDAYFFTAATYGGTQGNSFYVVNNLLKNQGIKLQAAFPIRMNGNYIVAYPTWDINKKDIPKIEMKIADAAKMVFCKKTTYIPTSKNIVFDFMHRKMIPVFLKKDKDFKASDACVSCGICYKVCPVENIKMVDGKPSFQGHCEQCMACIHACPQKALNYKNVTQKRLRYRNKDIKLSDLFHR